MMVGAVAAVEGEMAGKSLEEVQAANPLAPWSEDWGWSFIDADTFTALIYEDLSGGDHTEG